MRRAVGMTNYVFHGDYCGNMCRSPTGRGLRAAARPGRRRVLVITGTYSGTFCASGAQRGGASDDLDEDGDEFPAAARNLSDAAFRPHMESLCWSNSRLLDLMIPRHEVAGSPRRPTRPPRSRSWLRGRLAGLRRRRLQHRMPLRRLAARPRCDREAQSGRCSPQAPVPLHGTDDHSLC